jgi:hypothetical protein
MTAIAQRFQSFVTRVRPDRVAVLINSADADWQESCLGIIEFYTKLWGGTHCVIVPTDGKTIDETFWSVLSSHDPDSIYRYQRTGVDQRRHAPEKFAALLAEEISTYAKAIEREEAEVRAEIEAAMLQAPFDEWTIEDKLRDELIMRLAPFHFEKQPLHEMPDRQLNIYAITRGAAPSHPLTPIINILESSTRPEHFSQIVQDVDAATVPSPLWLAAVAGSVDKEYSSQLEKLGVTPRPILMSSYRVSEIIRWGINPLSNLSATSPFALTQTILTPLMATRARRFELPTIIVVGDTVQDFCLYHALYWQYLRAVWLPSWFLSVGDRDDRLMTLIRQAEERGRLEHNQQLSFVSYSVDNANLEALKQRIMGRMYQTRLSVETITAAGVSHWLQHPSRVYAEGNLGDVTSHLLFNDDLPGPFESPLPRKLSPVDPTRHRWLVDIMFIKNLIPRHPALGRTVVHGPNVEDVRAGREAVTYMCPGAFIMGNHMETNMLRPSIHVPGAEELFRIVLDDCGYRSQTSDKGRYEDAAVRKFGGLDRAGYALSSGKHRTLLAKYCDKSASTKGVLDEGVFLKGDQRRYMDFASIKKVLQSDSLSYDLIDEYVEKEIFYRGYIFQCENCSDAAWHSIGHLDQTFTCRRCGLNQQYKHQHWKMHNEPQWFYKLDEMVYLMLEHNGHVPLLTLNKLRASFEDSFLFRSELRIIPEGSSKTYLEMDICCIGNGKLCIGEAKSTGDLSGNNLTAIGTAARYRDLALRIGASIVVFSTSADAWTAASLKAINDSFAPHPHIQVRILTSDILYG